MFPFLFGLFLGGKDTPKETKYKQKKQKKSNRGENTGKEKPPKIGRVWRAWRYILFSAFILGRKNRKIN